MRFTEDARNVADEIIGAFREPNNLPKPLAQLFLHRNDGAPCRSWSWRNQFIVAIHGYSEARGCRQWKAVGRHVKKNENPIHILAPLCHKIVEEESGEERTALYGFKGIAVFGAEQTEGKAIPKDIGVEKWLSSLPLIEVATAWGLSVEAYNGGGGGNLGAFSPRKGIALGVRNLSTWAHELVHAADSRLGNLTKDDPKWRKETVAELGGAVLLQLVGRDRDADLGGCWEYIHRYARQQHKEVVEVCGKVLERTCNAVALILDTANGMHIGSDELLAATA